MVELKKLLPLIIYRECKRRNDSDARFTAADLDSACTTEGFKVTQNYVKKIIDSDYPYIEIDVPIIISWDGPNEPSTYFLTQQGIEEAERLQDEIYGDIPRDTPLAEAITPIKETKQLQKNISEDTVLAEVTAPAADRIVTLDHNSEPYKEVMDKLDELIKEVKKDLSNDFEEKERVLGELQAGKTLLKSLKVDKNKIMAVLIACLNWLKENLDNIIITGLATALLELLKALLG